MATADHAPGLVPKGMAWPWKLDTSLATRFRSALASWAGNEPAGTVYLLIDCSASMADADKLPQAKRGTLRFCAEVWQRDYAAGIIAFATRPWMLLKACRTHPNLPRRLNKLQPDGRTAMAGAIDLATRSLYRHNGERVICLITDGMPDSREATLRSASVARANGIEVIAIGTDGADEAFLATLTPRAELAMKVPRAQLEATIGSAAGVLAKPEGGQGTP